MVVNYRTHGIRPFYDFEVHFKEPKEFPWKTVQPWLLGFAVLGIFSVLLFLSFYQGYVEGYNTKRSDVIKDSGLIVWSGACNADEYIFRRCFKTEDGRLWQVR